ncbi:MAG TPA: acyltransferase family protein [Solirubrobacterales bacterium]|jgi:peptidoglycan/LPS O-acetylase OafA/YrhL|nr:acyltransferase family protein [Solirubrobacterales bacterium]
MPEPVKRNQRYMPGLDGLRAIAVLAVIAFHFGFDWAPGGLLGVGIFFTLSGYLITDILLSQLSQRGHIRLGRFWLARARRLLPALFAMLAIVVAWVTIFGPAQPQQFRDAVVASALYVSNWQLIFGDVSYFARFAPPGPLNHLWSLAIEEQFYIVWPFLLLIGVKVVRETPLASGVRPRLAIVTLALAIASAVLMALLYHPSLDPSRVYYGTDTRASELLFGAALAMVWPSRKLSRRIGAGARNTLDGLGVAGLAAIALMIWQSDQYSSFLYRGGFALLSIATVLVVAALAHPACRLGPILGWKPLRWIGVRSYGIYLWHFPVIVLTTPGGIANGAEPLRELLQFAAIVGISALSWRYLEEPVRHGALGRLWRRARAGGWRPENVSRQGWALAGASFVVLVAAGAGMAGVNSVAAEGRDVRVEEAVAAGTAQPPPLTPAQANSSTRSSCKAVVHIGDSTSEGLTSPEYLPLESQRIEAQYADVGAVEAHMEISGARSIEEQFEGEPNAQEVAEAWKFEGFHGCWVLALGTNEAANVFVGSAVGEMERIEIMMDTIGDEPVMWVNVRSLVEAGDPYAAENMEKWDEELLVACRRYPNMRVYDWASDVKDAWFIEDGIHFTSPGYAARSELIAHALAHAFPASGESEGGGNCVVS